MKTRFFALLTTALLFHISVIGQNESKTIIETPHISAREDAFAKTVLMPGDPLRAKYIAENFLENAELVTSVRNMLGCTAKVTKHIMTLHLGVLGCFWRSPT